MASPHVAGVAALLIGNGVATTPEQVRAALQGSALDLGASGWDATYGWGLLDAYAALHWGAPINLPPIANAGIDQSAHVGDTVHFDGSASTDPDGGALTYSCDFGDGTASATGVTADHIFTTTGTYAVTLTVTDPQGLTGTDTATVRLDAAPVGDGVLHISSIAVVLKSAGKNLSAQATITIHDGDGNPVVGAVVSGTWSGLTADSDTGTTGTNGELMLESNKVRNAKSGETFTFTVNGAVFGSWTWDGQNPSASTKVP